MKNKDYDNQEQTEEQKEKFREMMKKEILEKVNSPSCNR